MLKSEREHLRRLVDAKVREREAGRNIEGSFSPSHHKERPGSWMPFCRIPRTAGA